MKKANFVSFSHMIKNREREIVEEEEEIDYQALYEHALREKEELQAKLHQQQQQLLQHQHQWTLEKQQHQIVIEKCHEGALLLREELRAHLHKTWTSFFMQLVQNKSFHELALYDSLAQGMLDLSDQKNIHVEVPADLLDMAQELVAGREGWTIVGDNSLELGVRFSQEQVQWTTQLQPVIEQFFEALSRWLAREE